MEVIEMIKLINYIIAVVFFVCYSYQIAYILVPFLKREQPYKDTKLHRYAVLISARNEEAVIGHLMESIRQQDYPSNLVTVFVVADNCTDNTAETARKAGAAVYERFNAMHVGKGYALDFLLQNIHADYGDAFDGYFVFDADNLLQKDYISEMNRTFSNGFSIVTSYRNSKNFGDNWISAGYALWFLRESEYLNHARMLLGTSCSISGTGFLFSRDILTKCGGWKFYLLTEDIEFTVYNVIAGERVGYCKSAVLYDEQPVKFKQSWRQRMRWARGYLQVYLKYGKKLVGGLFRKRGFACFDMCMAIMPAIILTVVAIIANLTAAIVAAVSGQDLLIPIESLGQSLLNAYLFLLFVGGITTATQWKQIYTSAVKKLLYTFTFPLFMMTYIPISFIALFKKVEWKPIEHKVAVSIQELEQKITS
jgi:cellulose synthase/poly-beta-1,6-N-acetylglucosamine synthase-like glycosyltransferase